MNVVAYIVYRAAHGATITTLLLSLLACAGQPTDPQGPFTAQSDISAEDVEQVPITGISARERASQVSRDCRTPGGAGIGCAPSSRTSSSGFGDGGSFPGDDWRGP